MKSFYFFLAAQGADFLSTLYGWTKGNIELNPAAQSWQDLLFIKILSIALVAGTLFLLWRRARLLRIGLVMVSLLLYALALHNIVIAL